MKIHSSISMLSSFLKAVSESVSVHVHISYRLSPTFCEVTDLFIFYFFIKKTAWPTSVFPFYYFHFHLILILFFCYLVRRRNFFHLLLFFFFFF